MGFSNKEKRDKGLSWKTGSLQPELKPSLPAGLGAGEAPSPKAHCGPACRHTRLANPAERTAKPGEAMATVSALGPGFWAEAFGDFENHRVLQRVCSQKPRGGPLPQLERVRSGEFLNPAPIFCFL